MRGLVSIGDTNDVKHYETCKFTPRSDKVIVEFDVWVSSLIVYDLV